MAESTKRQPRRARLDASQRALALDVVRALYRLPRADAREGLLSFLAFAQSLGVIEPLESNSSEREAA